jgi:ribonuclease Y
VISLTHAILICVGVSVLVAVISVLVALKISKGSDAKKIGSAETRARDIIDEAIKTAESKKKEALLEAKEENLKTKNELDKEIKERRAEVQRYEKRVLNKEEAIDRKADALDKKENSIKAKEEALAETQEKVNKLSEQRLQELERISGLTSEQAKEYLLKTVEDEMKIETAKLVKELEVRAREEADKKAKEVIVNSIQKCATDHVSESTISVVSLPNDEMKGRIIGREGRNIRTLESLTGVDLIIDDTPEAVVLSGFDPIRREVARIALEKLIVDGRIQPTRIEEMVNKAKKEVEQTIREEGESATLDVGVHGIHPELVRLLGKMKFRTSYGQNALKHSIEVAHLSGLMAAELGLDVRIAKRAGLLHDIGKAVDHEMEGTHIQLGVDLCRKYKESATVINAVEAHHGDVEPESLIACIVQAADAISAARPGARRETLETYTNRLKQLEDITNSFEGVDKSFDIKAGREIRVMVVPEKVSDADMVLMAREISKQIEAELEYPGQIKVNVVRESRAIDYAK